MGASQSTSNSPRTLRQTTNSKTSAVQSHHSSKRYSLSIADIIVLSANFARNKSAKALPFDVLFVVLKDYVGHPTLVKKCRSERSYGDNADKIHMALLIQKIPYFLPRSISVQVVSKDQGWSSYPADQGKRNPSWTWGEVALSSSPQERYEIYRNIHAGKVLETHVFSFAKSHALTRRLRMLWSNTQVMRQEVVNIQLYARSRYPGWVNIIADAEITVEYELSEQITELGEEDGIKKLWAYIANQKKRDLLL